MKPLRLAALLPVLAALCLAWPAAAAEPARADAGTVSESVPSLQACPPASRQRLDLAEVSQTDCCKGHKGVCGCRAGKIVCCDGSVSPNCTCHGDDPAFIP